MNIEPRIYSYSRISTVKQLAGTGLAQQQEQSVLAELSAKYGLPVSEEVFSDVGKSAYHGKHLEGQLGRILALISDGSICAGSILVIYNIDRLSREQVNKAMQLLLTIINQGVKVYTISDDKMYCADDSNLMADLILSLVYMSRANDESKTKSKRTKGHALRMIQDHQDGIRCPDTGYAFAIKSVAAKHIWYIDTSSGVVKPHEYYWPIARLVAEKLIEGHSVQQIKALLDGKYKTPSGKDNWPVSTITRFHKREALTGNKGLTINDVDYVLKDYYPRLINDGELAQLKAIRKTKSTYHPPTGVINLVTGMNTARCVCGGPLGAQVRGSNNDVAVFCSHSRKKQNDCTGFSVKAEYIENALLRLVADGINEADVTSSDTAKSEIAVLTMEIESKQTNLDKMAELALSGSLPEILMAKMITVESEIDALRINLEQLTDAIPAKTDTLINEWQDIIPVLPPLSDTEARTKLKNLVKRSVSKILVERLEGYSRYKFTFELANGAVRSVVCHRGKMALPRSNKEIPYDVGSHAVPFESTRLGRCTGLTGEAIIRPEPRDELIQTDRNETESLFIEENEKLHEAGLQ